MKTVDMISCHCKVQTSEPFNPLTPMSDRDWISPYYFKPTSSKQVMRVKKDLYQLGDYQLIQYQILQNNTKRVIWQTVRRIASEILGVKGLIPESDEHLISPFNITPQSNIKVMTIKEMTINEEPLDFQTNSPCQHIKKCMKNSMEIIHTDVRV